MKHRFAVVVALCACVALLLVSTAQTLAQEKKAAEKPVRYSGTIKVINKDEKSFTLQTADAAGGIQVKYTDNTKFTYRNKASSVAELKEGRRVIVLVDPVQKPLVAVRVDVREK